MKLKKIDNTDKFEVYGYFYIEDEKHSGVLSSDGTNYILKVFSEEKIFNQNKIDKNIFFTLHGEKIYLISGFLTMNNENYPGLFLNEYLINEFWVSNYSTNLINSCDSCLIEFSGLKYYILTTPFKIMRNNSHFEIDLINERNIAITENLDNPILYKGINININPRLYEEISFYYNNFLELAYKEKVSVYKILEDITDVCYLFSFVTNQKHQIDSVTLRNDDNTFRVFRTSPYKFEAYHKNAYRYEISNFINKYFGVIYEFYYTNPMVFKDVFSLYIKLMYTTNFIDYYLVDLLKLLEGIHRRLINGKKINLVRRYKEMLEMLDKNLQNYLKKLIVFDESIHDFMKEYRHYYSHFWLPEETLEYKYDTNFNVSNYSVQLLKAVILSNVGVPTEDIIKILKYTHRS